MKTLTQFIKESIGESKLIYIDTTNFDGYEKDIEDFCENEDIDVPEEGSSEWWDIVREIKQQENDAFWETLAYSKYNDRYCILTGSDGLWDGRHEIVPEFYSSLEDAIKACLGRSIDDYRVYTENGYVYVDAYHHDGTNKYQIRVIKDDPESRIKFEDYRELYEDDENDFESLDWDSITDYVKELY